MVGPGRGKTLVRACAVKAVSPSLKLGNALKMHHWQAQLKDAGYKCDKTQDIRLALEGSFEVC